MAKKIPRASFNRIKAATPELNNMMIRSPSSDVCDVCLSPTYSTFAVDYAQNVSIPSTKRQSASMYSASPFRLYAFGIIDESAVKQHHIFYGEDRQSKGANIVTSMLFDLLNPKKTK